VIPTPTGLLGKAYYLDIEIDATLRAEGTSHWKLMRSMRYLDVEYYWQLRMLEA